MMVDILTARAAQTKSTCENTATVGRVEVMSVGSSDVSFVPAFAESGDEVLSISSGSGGSLRGEEVVRHDHPQVAALRGGSIFTSSPLSTLALFSGTNHPT